jgi:endonuclease YncB( thermonuclease family)
MNYERRARLDRVKDGDTVQGVVDLGYRAAYTGPLRLRGVDCPPLSSVAGKAARDFVHSWLTSAVHGVLGTPHKQWPFSVTSYKDEMSYERYIADVVRVDTGESLAEALIAAGHGVRV